MGTRTSASSANPGFNVLFYEKSDRTLKFYD